MSGDSFVILCLKVQNPESVFIYISEDQHIKDLLIRPLCTIIRPGSELAAKSVENACFLAIAAF